jgi:hypothetical protein
MTYSTLKAIINAEYANFCTEYISRRRLGADDEYPTHVRNFVKCMYKVLMDQEGDTAKDLLTKVQIQNIIRMFNKYSDSTINIEYT